MTAERKRGPWQGPTHGDLARTSAQFLQIVTHPAFRIGFLDAQRAHPLDHDLIAMRITSETPASYWQRSRRSPDAFQSRDAIELAQYRYEEGRLAVLVLDLRCRAWGDPDYPPTSVRKHIQKVAVEDTK